LPHFSYFCILILEIKKNIGADIERWRPQAFLLGVIAVLAFLAVALEITFSVGDAILAESDSEEPDFELMLSHDENDGMVAVPQEKEGIVSPDRVEAAPKQIDNWEDLVMRDIEQAATEKPQDIKEMLEELKETIPTDEPIDYKVVEQLPQFPGGMAALVAWLTKNLRYPQAAARNKTEGVVEVQFIINLDGSISDLSLLKKQERSLDREALRVVSMMPKWEKPGQYEGKPCRTLFVIPIEFKL